MATSRLLPAMESPPRKRKPATYGKQSRIYTRDFDDDFGLTDELDSRSNSPPSHHLTTPKKPTASPRKRSLDKSDSGLGDFDIPSSDDETPRQALHAVASGKLTKTGRPKARELPQVRTTARSDTLALPDHPKRRKIDADTSASRATSTTIPRSQPVIIKTTRTRREVSPSCDGLEYEHQAVKSTSYTVLPSKASAHRTLMEGVQQRARCAKTEVGTRKPREQAKAKRSQAKSPKPPPRTYGSKRAGHDPSRLSTPPEDATTSRSPRRTPRHKTPSTPPRQTPRNDALHTPSQLLSTPRQSPMAASPTPAPHAVMTPKQKRLWSTVLGEPQDVMETPSRSFKKLSLVSQSRPELLEGLDTPRKRRLIDMLKDTAQDEPSSDDVDIDDLASEQTDLADMETVASEDVDAMDVDADEAEASTNMLGEDKDTQDKQMSNSQSQAPAHKFTYGGQRTFLQDKNQSFEEMLAQPLDDDFPSPIIATSRHMASNDHTVTQKKDEFDISDDETGTSAMRSVFELRAAAKSKTFSTDLDSIVDDLRDDSDAGRSRRQRALIELWKSLLNRQNRILFTQTGSEIHVFEALRNAQDVVTKSTAAAVLIGVLDDQDSTIDMARVCQAGVVDLLTSILNDDRSLVAIARHRQSNMTKLSQASVADMQSEMLKQDIWLSAKVQNLSPQLLSLRGLECLVRKLRESGNVGMALLTNAMLTKLLAIVGSDALPNIQRGRAVPTALLKLETVMSILESCSLSQSCIADHSIWTASSLIELIEAMTVSLSLDGADDCQTKASVLRITVNLANEKQNAQHFARPAFLTEMLSIIVCGLKRVDTGIEDGSHLDQLLLALGAMVNLAESSSFVRQPNLNLQLGSIDKLALAFVANRKRAADADSLEKSRANVPYGYLAMLLGHLCQEPALKVRIASKLPGKRLDTVIAAVEEFVSYHQVADKVEGSDEAYASFTARLQPVVETLKALDR